MEVSEDAELEQVVADVAEVVLVDEEVVVVLVDVVPKTLDLQNM